MTLSTIQGPTLTIRHTGQVFALGRTPITIGGQEENTIILADPDVSPLHAIISWQGEAYMVVDAGSVQGTYLDGRRLHGPRPLRDGSVVRIGHTIFDFQIPAAGGPRTGERKDAAARKGRTAGDEETAGGGKGRSLPTPVIVGLLAGAFLVVCLVAAVVFFLLGSGRGGPNVTLQSPEQDAQVALGESIVLKASATGARDIARLELSVDGSVVGSVQSTYEDGQATLATSLPWIFDAAGAHAVTATAYRAGRKTGSSVSHQVTVIDTSGGGTPNPAPLGTATPAATPSPTGTETPTPTPTATGTPEILPLPVIEFFRANPETIDAGACTTLEWGQVSYAVAATIDHGIGGVGTPGSQVVCPTETTSYVMTAGGPGGVTTLSASVTVLAGQPDLVIDSVSFNPYPPVAGGDTLVQVQIRNAGKAAAGAFAWEWQAGSASPFSGTIAEGLGAGASLTASLTWRPDGAYTELLTSARVDTGNAVAESDESNNERQEAIQVMAASTTVVLPGDAGLDGYVTGGQGAYPVGEVRIGNEGEAVQRGFLSFDLNTIPTGASIQNVQLRFYQVNIIGQPYQKLGGLVLTLVDYGSSLDVSDFDSPGLGAVPLGKQNRPGSWFEVSSTEIGPWIDLARSAGMTSLQLRIRFEVEADGDEEADYVQVEAADNSLGTGNVPELTITYSMP